MIAQPRGWSRSRPALRLLLVVALTVGSVLTAVLWWFGSHESARLDAAQHELSTRTAQLAQVLVRNRLERGQTVLRAIATSRAVQDALLDRNPAALAKAIQPFQSEFSSTMLVIDDSTGMPMASSTPLAQVVLGIDVNSVEGGVHQALSVAAGDLVMRFEQPIESARRPIGRLRGAVTLGRLFVQQLTRDLRTPLAVFVDGNLVHHTFPSSPVVPLDVDSRATIGGEQYDITSQPLAQVGENVVLVVGVSRASIVEAERRTRLLLSLLGVGGLVLTLAAVGGYLALGAAQERLARQRDEAEERTRDTQDRFEALRAVVHDIKAPVSGIQLRCEGLLDHEPEAPMAAALSQISDTCERLNLYLANVLTAAEAEGAPIVLAKEVVLVPGLLHELAERIEPLAQRRRVALTVDAQASLPPIQGDAALLERALWNLAANALAAAPAGGSVVLFARRHESELHLGAEDNGPGFQGFDPAQAFSRERPKVKHGSYRAGSSGLGLFIVARVAESHQGRAVAENRAEGGARVSLCLPLP